MTPHDEVDRLLLELGYPLGAVAADTINHWLARGLSPEEVIEEMGLTRLRHPDEIAEANIGADQECDAHLGATRE